MEYQQNKDGLQVQGLKVDFKIEDGVIHALKGVDLSVKKGKITALVGESGSGKSVTSLAIMGLLASNTLACQGTITIDGKDVSKLSKKERQSINGSTVGMIFQDPVDSLNPLYTVGNQMIEGLVQHRKLSKAEAREKAIQHLKAVNLQNPEAPDEKISL